MAKNTFNISGRVIDSASGSGIAGLKVEAWDKDLLFDDLVGSTETQVDGSFEFKFDSSYFKELFLDRSPDLFFKVFHNESLIKSTEDSVLWNVSQPDVHVVIPVSADDLQPPENQPLYQVSGLVTTEDGRAVREVIVEVWDQRLGGENLIASGATDRSGRYLVCYDPSDLDGKSHADIMVRVLDPGRQRVELARSDVIYQADPVIVVNLVVVAAEVNRPSEYERLLKATETLLEQTPLVELDADAVVYIASRSGWDARLVAMAAEAARLNAITGIPAAHYYALMRSELSAESIHQLPESSVQTALETAIASAVITDDHPIDATLKIYQQQNIPALQAYTSAAAVSSLGDMLDLSLDDERKQQFLQAYQSTAGQPEKLWTTLADSGFDEALIDQLKTEGKLGFITRQNAPLVARLGSEADISRVEDLPRAGLYKADAWKPLIGDNIPPQLSVDEYAAGLAVQVNMAYPTLVTAEMVRRGEIAVDAGRDDGESNIAAFLRSSHDQHSIGVEPIKRWTGYTKLSAQDQEKARQIERLYQMSPSNESMVALSNLGLNSAYQITRESKAVFMQKYAGEFPEPTQAELVYRKAQQVHTTALNLATMYITYRSAPDLYAINDSATKEVFDFSDVPGAPALEDLLGNLDYCACEHCKSVLSPAAYYVELLRFIDVAEVPASTRNPLEVLFERRPDLQHLLLSCENTNIVLPYIDLVNEILEYYVVNGSLDSFTGYNMRGDSNTADLLADPEYVQASAYDITRAEVYPYHLPFDMPVAALRLFMQAWGTTLPAALRIFGSSAAARRETLKLNAAEYSILTDVEYRALPEYFGEAANATIEDLNAAVAEGKTFCRRTEISYEDLIGLLKTQFINPGLVLVPRLEALQLSLEQLQSWYDGALDDAGLEALLPTDIDATDYDGDILQWLSGNQVLIMGLITLTDISPEPVDCDFAMLELRFALPDADLNRLTPIAFHKLLRFTRLWKKLGWSIELTDRIVSSFLGLPSQEMTVDNIDTVFTSLLARIANFVWLMQRLSVSDKKFGDWLTVWDLAQTSAMRQEKLAHLLRFGTTDLAHLAEITGIDPLADDLHEDAASVHRFIDAWDLLKTTKLEVSDIDYLLRHRDDAGKLAPGEDMLLLVLKEVHDALTAVDAELSVPAEAADFAYARNKMALVYDTSIVDWFIGLVSASRTYDAPFTTVEEALPAKLTAADAQIDFDAFQKVLAYTGVMSDAARLALANAADTLVLADMVVIDTQPDLDVFIAAFKVAVQAIADAAAADVQELADQYPELQMVYDTVVAAPDPSSQAQILVDEIVPALRQQLKALSLRTVLATLLKIDQQLVDVLTEGPSVLHANSDVTKAVLEDFLALEAPGAFDASQSYNIHIDPPATDDYILYVHAPTGTQVTLSIEGTEVISTSTVDADEVVSSGMAVTLTSGELTAVTLTLASLPVNSLAELHWRTNAMAKTAVPLARMVDDIRLLEARASLIRLQKTALLLHEMPLTPRELRHLAVVDADTAGYLNDLDTDGSISAGQLHDLWTKFIWVAWFSNLKAAEPDENTWVSLLEDPGQLTVQGIPVLASANAWSEQDLVDTLTHFGLAITDVSSLQVLRKVRDALDFVTETNQSAGDMLAWAVDVPDAALIGNIKQKLRERQDEQSWRATLQSVNDALRNQRRDALVSYILHHSAPASSINTPDKLYEYFLIDIEMDACRKTSRIRQALSTAQLFVTRCLMNLEPEVVASSINEAQWAWMKRYRVWEANRKIFLWPENWLEPELRDNKSPFFRELESDLLKSDITDDLAENAYLAYLKKLDEVARLEIMGSYLQQQTSDQDDDILHVFGRTNGSTHQYYYRRYEYGKWTPWEKLSLNIQGDLLFPVIWKNQLFVFWLTAVPKPGDDDRSKTPQEMADEDWGSNAKINVELHLSWGEYYDGKWMSPKSSELNDPILLEGLSNFEPDKISVVARTERPGPKISERLVVVVRYLGSPWHASKIIFTSKNCQPNVFNGEADSELFQNPEIFYTILYWSADWDAKIESNALRVPGRVFNVTIMQPSGATSGTYSQKLLEKTSNLEEDFHLRSIMHPVENQWEAPLFYSDEHSVFFISPDERLKSVRDYNGFYWNDAESVLVSPEKIEIPRLYEKPIISDPAGPIADPFEDYINPNYELAISNNNVFVYRDTAFDANGVVTREIGQ